VAIIVDISPPGGKFVIGKPSQTPWDTELVVERATEGEGQLLIWSWQHEWRFYAVGSIQIRYLVKSSAAI
jgi:hypothetical protein